MEMIKRDRALIENGISPALLKGCIAEHQNRISRFDRLYNYYTGNHDILQRQKVGEFAPNNKIVCNFPKYITDTASGHMFGNPIIFQSAQDADGLDLTDLQSAFKQADTNTHDAEMGKCLSVFGVCYELMYMSSDDISLPKIAIMDPRNAFVVYDDTVEEKALFGCCYYPKYDAEGKIKSYAIVVYTENLMLNYTAKDRGGDPVFVNEESHYFGGVPLIQYWNNEEGMGDFENIMGLVDAYNILQSDRVNDKEMFVNSILLIKNANFSDGDSEEAKKIIQDGVLQLPQDSDASYLTKTMNESETEVLKKALAADIHKFSQTPDFTDEQFSGNTSGVALKYKLLSLENLAKVKERFFTEGLKARIRLFANILHIKSKAPVDTSAIEIVFSRTLPTNDFENAQMVATLTNIVSTKTLLTQLPFVKDIPGEMEKKNAERLEKEKAMLGLFSEDGNNDDVRL